MPWKSLFLVLTLMVSTVGVPQAFAASDNAAAAQAAKQQRMAAAKQAKAKQAALAKQKALQQAQADKEEKKDRYSEERDHGLDIAHEYAPKAIDRVRAKNYVAKGDTVNTGNGKQGWRQYVDKYYSR